MVVLPDHLHSIWTLPEGDRNFSMRWRIIKGEFSRKCSEACKGPIPKSRQNKHEQGVWQRRFWEHEIRDERDFGRHVEYIHYNPVKHGLVKAPKDWPHSSFDRFVQEGLYDRQWGAEEEMRFASDVGAE
jgi:putative transposase